MFGDAIVGCEAVSDLGITVMTFTTALTAPVTLNASLGVMVLLHGSPAIFDEVVAASAAPIRVFFPAAETLTTAAAGSVGKIVVVFAARTDLRTMVACDFTAILPVPAGVILFAEAAEASSGRTIFQSDPQGLGIVASAVLDIRDVVWGPPLGLETFSEVDAPIVILSPHFLTCVELATAQAMDFLGGQTLPTMTQDGGMTGYGFTFVEVTSDGAFAVEAILV